NLKTLGVINARGIALEEIGLPIPNTVVAGAFARMSGILDIEPVTEALSDFFSGSRLYANQTCARRGFEELVIMHF
ncbi:MAG: 2-oxoacid:acceptor oxidoreductase family protein, partial [Desulfobacterales bacterium]|nr:2-oxoacid:acceptor oxidoreductase family protein [Desulfobacterales bacterium]